MVTVIIPVYNTAAYLRRCLDSVCGQTYRNFEIICVNDGSTDVSDAILHSVAEHDSRVRVITQENAGVSAARNKAMGMAQGEWVMFVDSDDYLEETYIQAFVEAVAKFPEVDLLQAGVTYVDGGGCVLGTRGNSRSGLLPGFHEGSYEKLLLGVWGESWAKMLRMSIIREHRLFFDSKLKVSEDQEFICRYLMWCKGVCLVEHAGYNYVQYPGSAIHRFFAGEMPVEVYMRTTLYYIRLISGLPDLFSKETKRSCARGLAHLCITAYTWRSGCLAGRYSHTWAQATWVLMLCVPYMMWKAGLRMGCSRRELRQFARQVRAALRVGV